MLNKELDFNTKEKSCNYKEYDTHYCVYVCLDCKRTFLLPDESYFKDSVGQHLEKTGHTVKRIW